MSDPQDTPIQPAADGQPVSPGTGQEQAPEIPDRTPVAPQPGQAAQATGMDAVTQLGTAAVPADAPLGPSAVFQPAFQPGDSLPEPAPEFQSEPAAESTIPSAIMIPPTQSKPASPGPSAWTGSQVAPPAPPRPVAPAAAPSRTPLVAGDGDEKASKPPIPKDCTVLVVEDNVSNFVLIARLLGYLGVHCEWKTSGYEVVEYADNFPRLDLVLMDIRLPYEDGYGALKKIRASERLKNVPIVAVTAEASLEQMEKARTSGFDGFLGKPLDPDRFPEQIRDILSGEPVWEMS